ncbi:hypothetical protein C1M53_30630 [Mesorhizobium sp. Pch-S]|nr:hypothetical protein C1M53_30630 [Mesorhizobium sp. Pch-S]
MTRLGPATEGFQTRPTNVPLAKTSIVTVTCSCFGAIRFDFQDVRKLQRGAWLLHQPVDHRIIVRQSELERLAGSAPMQGRTPEAFLSPSQMMLAPTTSRASKKISARIHPPAFDNRVDNRQ